MGLFTNIYFAPAIRVEDRETYNVEYDYRCENGHCCKPMHKFCADCGTPVQTQEKYVKGIQNVWHLFEDDRFIVHHYDNHTYLISNITPDRKVNYNEVVAISELEKQDKINIFMRKHADDIKFLEDIHGYDVTVDYYLFYDYS
jgi:uncharacterized OB-fold protein